MNFFIDKSRNAVVIGNEGITASNLGNLHLADTRGSFVTANIDNAGATPTSSAFLSLHTRDVGGDPVIGFGIRDGAWQSIHHSYHLGIDNDDNDAFKISQGSIGGPGADKIILTLEGNVGIGVVHPIARLDVDGALHIAPSPQPPPTPESGCTLWCAVVDGGTQIMATFPDGSTVVLGSQPGSAPGAASLTQHTKGA